MIKYLGSKRRLLPQLTALFGALPDAHHVLDLFSGTARVGRALKAAGHQVTSCDELTFAATLARCYVQADPAKVTPRVKRALKELAALPPKPGYFTKTFCEDARFFQPKNGARIDAMRDGLDDLDLDEDTRAVVMVALMEAADRVDSTTGVHMAYLKQWARRAHNDLELRMPELVPGTGRAHLESAATVARTTPADAAYLDPPYNQHSYLGNYHVWETLVRWDAPEAYGVAQKRIDRKTRKCAFNSKRAIEGALKEVLDALDVRHVVVSFNDEGYLSRDQLIEMLSPRGHVEVVAIDHARYVGAKIGIHDPSGQKVGKVSHTRNQELLFIATGRPADAQAAAAACTRA